MNIKNLILITSPPACGKTTLAKKLAKELYETVYLDKDTLIPLSKKIFEVAKEEYNRSSEFFENHVRDLEYRVILDLAFDAIEFDSNVIINAPFSKELKNKQYIEDLKDRLKQYNAELRVIWIECSEETAHKRMLKRNSDRDTWKLQHWKEYLKTENFNVPDIKDLLIYKNDNEEEEKESFKKLVERLKISTQK